MIPEKSLIACALDAAVEAAEHSEDAHLPLSEISDRNEQWIASYLAIRLNDLAREYSGDRGVYVTSEARVSWLPEMCGVDHPESVEKALQGSELTAGRKFDLAVWSEDRVLGLVEIKNAPGMDSFRFQDDLMKLDAALKIVGQARGSGLKWGIYLFSVRLTKKQLSSGATVQSLLDKRLNAIDCQLHSERAAVSPVKVASADGWALGWGLIFLRARM